MGAYTCGLLLGLALKFLMRVVVLWSLLLLSARCDCVQYLGLCGSVPIDGDFFTRWQHQPARIPTRTECLLTYWPLPYIMGCVCAGDLCVTATMCVCVCALLSSCTFRSVVLAL